MNTGDILTRKVNSAAYDPIDDDVTMTLNVVLDRDVAVADQFRIGRLILARYNDDGFDISCITDQTTEIVHTFREVPREYP